MRLYGDESFSGFFRRLSFSPDGALLVTPTGVFETNSATSINGLPGTSSNLMHTPASPTVASTGREGISPSSPLIPAGAAQPREPPARNTVYLYARSNLHRSNAPIAHLPGHKTATLVVKFSPILYELRKLGPAGRQTADDDGIPPHPTVPLEAGKQKTVALFSAASAAGGHASSEAIAADGVSQTGDSDTADSPSTTRKRDAASTVSMIGLPYRMIFAVATHDSVWIYDTQQGGPLCCFSNMHYASFTDLTWSPDGQTLMMCSTDGYCSIVVFDYGELGTPYAYASQPSLQQTSAPTSVLKMSGSPMMRRASAQSLPGMQGQQATPPSMLSHSFASSGVHAAPELSPSLGLGLLSESENGGLNVKSAIREIDPPVIPVHQTPSTSTLPATAGTIEGSATTDVSSTQTAQQQQRKKRRIVPTLEGPIGS
jgi:chromatin assembly factor 1 subunit B